MATPMARGSYLASHLLSRLTFLVLEVTILLVFARLVFGVRSAGSLATVAGAVPAGRALPSRASGCWWPRGRAPSRECRGS